MLGETPELPFLGPAGTSVWHLDGGWTVRGVAEGVFVGDELEIQLEHVDGPGAFAVWRFGVLEPEVTFASVSELPQRLVVDRAAHVHRT